MKKLHGECTIKLTLGHGAIRMLTIAGLFLITLLPCAALSQQTTPTITPSDEGPVLKVGYGVSAPTILSKVDPQYAEEARKAGVQGTVVMAAIIHKDGSVQIVRVVRGVGFGLDEKAVESMRQWKFNPALQSGAPVPVALNIETNFNLAPGKNSKPIENRTVDATSGKLVPGQYAYISCADRDQKDLPFASMSSTEPKQVRCGARVIFIRFDHDSGNAQVKIDDPFTDPKIDGEGYISGTFVSGVPQK